MSIKKYEENHFLRGDRYLREADVEIAKYFGPVLVAVAKSQKTISFQEFLEHARRNFHDVPAITKSIAVISGRRFEAFRLYLRFHKLPDPSSWITDKKENNSLEYTTDFDPLSQRQASANQDWLHYVPRKKNLSGVPRYTTFFTSLEKFTKANSRNRTGEDLRIHLAKLKIRTMLTELKSTLDDKKISKLAVEQTKNQTIWIERVSSGEEFEDIINEIFNDN